MQVPARAKTFLVSMLGCVTAIVLWIVGLHLYEDHQNLHALVNRAVIQDQKSATTPSSDVKK